ncbi:hypothetical protein NGR_b12270 (plasmid) [Sinorhizobium fredii NGR234]|uniref:Uncharacterized protein n=1 Tax=Sinorhizobium fredii (strain NBRC 101917 / NGR234) TaxID=394 RepID=C3KRH2_SINFN|nr:hypothetical protein NGR_b12270 [Sinorhizobium fredii NGR234]
MPLDTECLSGDFGCGPELKVLSSGPKVASSDSRLGSPVPGLKIGGRPTFHLGYSVRLFRRVL